ncbi:MAG TPA: hypothetical protein PKV98_04655 [Burkholderiaceae bacterium]|nr:hypothetical protein [Burkholderiaceae bacterium]
MAVIKLTSFGGKFPRMEARSLADNAAQSAVNCDFSGPQLRGIKDVGLVSVMPNIGTEPIMAVWTENGYSFFAWPWEVDVVKSPVIDDFQRRILYSAMPGTGLVLKQARTRRDDGTIVIANDNILGNGSPGSGNYKPPEISSPGAIGSGPDSWVLGIAPPKVWDTSYDDLPTVTLVDRSNYPDAPNLRLKVTYIIESPTGEILFQKNISNNEAAKIGLETHPQVYYTNNTPDRGNLIQDMLWPLTYTPRPLKYYWFEPPPTEDVVFSRSVLMTNTDDTNIVIEYDTTTPSNEPGNPDGPPTVDAPGVIIDNEDQ